MSHFHWLENKRRKEAFLFEFSCTQFLHGYTVFPMQEQAPFWSIPMEYHLDKQVKKIDLITILYDFFFQFLS
jgi:hypothetical protein